MNHNFSRAQGYVFQVLCVNYNKSVNTYLVPTVSQLHADLKFVFQMIQVFHYYSRTISEDVCDLLDGEQALLSEEHHHMFYRLHRHSQERRVIGHQSLKTA